MVKQKAAPPQNGHPLTNNKDSKPLGKLDSMLQYFSSGNRIHRFQAEKLGDHCLHSTISDLQARHSIEFHREWVLVPNKFGSYTRVKLYWLEGKDLESARSIVAIRRRAE